MNPFTRGAIIGYCLAIIANEIDKRLRMAREIAQINLMVEQTRRQVRLMDMPLDQRAAEERRSRARKN